MPLIIYHNTRCSKSRGVVQLLEERGIPFELRLYMEKPLTVAKLRSLLRKLKMPPSGLLRKGEELYKALSEKPRTEDEWLELMIAHPQLMERPIAEHGRKALIARPPEQVLALC